MEHLLYDSSVLRKDEFTILLQHLLENTEGGRKLKPEKERACDTYRSPVHNKALLKMHGDLTNMIREQRCIDINYEEQSTYKIISFEIIRPQNSKERAMVKQYMDNHIEK